MLASERFVTYPVELLLVGEPLPANLYIHIDFRFIPYRLAGAKLDVSTFDRLILKQVHFLFIKSDDEPAFKQWSTSRKEGGEPPVSEAYPAFHDAREKLKRKAMDIFTSPQPEKHIAQVIQASKGVVAEVMQFPYAAQTLQQLQTFSRSSADHSVNVSVLSVYLAMQIGYSHQVILQHVGAGGLLHDIGKSKLTPVEGELTPEIKETLKAHVELGLQILNETEGATEVTIPHEVKMIVAQHHEYYDGSGYPKKLRGNAIYDLARIVTIANRFDDLVANASGNLKDRQKKAIEELEKKLQRKFDPQKLEKILKVLKMGL